MMRSIEQNLEIFLERIRARAAFESISESETAAKAVLSVLSRLLPVALRSDLRKHLPSSLVDCVAETGRNSLQSTPEEFFEAVAELESLPRGFAKEHIGIVCQALWCLLPAELCRRIELSVGDELGLMFARQEPSAKVTKPIHQERTTLSSGRPGGHDPLSESTGELCEDPIASGRPGGKRPIHDAGPRRLANRDREIPPDEK